MYQFILVLAVIISLIYYYLVKNYDHWRKKGVVYAKPSLFVGNIGDIVRMKTTIGEGYQKIYNEYEGHDYVGIYELRTPALLIRDPKLAKQICITDFHNHFHSRGLGFNTKAEPLSGNLSNLTGDKWRKLRTKLTPIFTSSKIREICGEMAKTAEQFSEFVRQYADSEETVEIRDFAAKYTSEVISTCCFGFESNSIQHGDSEFRMICKKVVDPSAIITLKRAVRTFMPWLYNQLQIVVNPKEVSDYVLKVVHDVTTYREKNNVSRPDFMQALLELKNESARKTAMSQRNHDKQGKQEEEQKNGEASKNDDNDEVIDEVVIASQAFLFLFAGFETSSTAMSFALYELACNPEIQDKLYNEIRDTLEKYGSASYEAISEMNYLDRVVKEALRIHPPGGILRRMCFEDYVIPGTDTVIEKGTIISIPVHAFHHDPKYYENPSKFEPDRFLDKPTKQHVADTFLPFGMGPRICIGWRFAYAQAKVGLAVFLRDYEVSLSPKTDCPLKYDPKSLVLTSVSGIWLKVHRRQK